MIIPQLVKSGSTTVKLGVNSEPPKVDCRVWAEDSYQEIVSVIHEVMKKDIESYIKGESPLLPQQLRMKIYMFLKENSKV